MQPAAFLLLADKSARMKRAAAAELPGISFSFFFFISSRNETSFLAVNL
jgi:hypothetical protein